jgi:cytidyltransferase-like protein
MIINLEELPKLRARYKGKKIVFCSGSFDLTHVGHVVFFENCKKHGDILVVSVGDDRIIKFLKGKKRPILNESTRLKMVDSIKAVDYCFLDKYTLESDLHSMFKLVFEKLKPDFYIINNDVSDIPLRKRLAEKQGVGFVILNREDKTGFEEVSSTNMLQKIQEDLRDGEKLSGN